MSIKERFIFGLDHGQSSEVPLLELRSNNASKLHVKLIDTVRESGALQLQEERARRSAGL